MPRMDEVGEEVME